MRANLLLLLLLLSTGVSTQSIRFEQLNVEQGLSQNTVNCVLKDRRGYLWIGTNDGLNKYDGYQFSILRNDSRDSASLSDNKVYALLEDRAGRLWVGTKNGLNRYDRTTNGFRRYLRGDKNKPNLTDNFVRSLLEDRNGRLWIGTMDGDLNLWDEEREMFFPVTLRNNAVPEDQLQDIASIIEDHRGELWLTSNSPGLFRYDPEERVAHYFPFPEGQDNAFFPKKIYEDSKGQIWVATQGGGVYVLDADRERFRHFNVEKGHLRNDVAKDVIEDDRGRIWIATDGGGIALYHPGEQVFDYVLYEANQPFSLGSNAVYTLFKDNEGILWVGTFDAGISIYNKNQKAFHFAGVNPRPDKGLSHRSVLCFLEDRDGHIWIGTDGGGLNRFDREKLAFQAFRHREPEEDGLSSDVVTALHEDRQGRIWIGTYQGGLQCMQHGRFIATFRHDPQISASIRNNNVWSILEDRRGSLWIGTLGGLDRLDTDSGQFEHIPTEDGRNEVHLERVTELYEDRNGAIWVGGKGVRFYDAEHNVLRRLEGQAGAALATFDIRAFYEDRQGRFWIGAEGGGLFLLDRQNVSARIFTVADGLPSNAVHTLLEDEQGALWMSTNQGLSRFRPADLLKADAETSRPVFRNYCKQDGLQSNQFSYSAGLKTRDGALHFGGVNGFNYFFPEEIIDNPYRPAIEITALKIYDRYVDVHSENSPLDQPISELQELILPHGQSEVFSLEFTALNFTSSDKNQYAYQLEGFIDEWSNIGSQRSVTFTNLNPGTYTFRVKASNNDGVWNEEGRSLRLTILPPWWKTNWAYGAYVLLFLLILLAFRYTLLLRERMKHDLKIKDLERRKAEEVNRLKLAFFTNISHELRTPLTLITAPVEQLLTSSGLPGEARHRLQMVQRNTKRLLRLINQLLEFRKIEDQKVDLERKNVDVVQLVRVVKEAFDDLAAVKDVTFQWESAVSSLPARVDPDKVEKILYNLLSNAFKFTTDQVTLRLGRASAGEVEGDPEAYFCIEVQDNGPGIPLDKQAQVFDRFYQINQRREGEASLSATGTGIGLAYAKALVELHAGTIRVESELHRGACFKVWLPLAPEEGEEAPLTEEWVRGEDPGKIEKHPADPIQTAIDPRLLEVLSVAGTEAKPMLLIVEDHADVRTFIRDSFRHQFRVLEAADGREGEDLALKHLPDIVISDIMMPKKDGIELCRVLKTDNRTSHIPILLLTADASEERWLKGLETGADDYITKPFKFRLLKARVENLIRVRAQLREHFSRQLLHPGPLEMESADEVFLRKAIAIIESNLADSEFGVNEFAHKLGMSRSVLYRKFSALTDLPVKELINMIRLRRAAQLLVSGADLSVAEVAYAVGFSDSQYFSKKFKKFFHCTPTQYIEKEGRSAV